MIMRPEDGVWKIVHRHADLITTAQPALVVHHHALVIACRPPCRAPRCLEPCRAARCLEIFVVARPQYARHTHAHARGSRQRRHPRPMRSLGRSRHDTPRARLDAVKKILGTRSARGVSAAWLAARGSRIIEPAEQHRVDRFVAFLRRERPSQPLHRGECRLKEGPSQQHFPGRPIGPMRSVQLGT
jgi:hypothetical protein